MRGLKHVTRRANNEELFDEEKNREIKTNAYPSPSISIMQSQLFGRKRTRTPGVVITLKRPSPSTRRLYFAVPFPSLISLITALLACGKPSTITLMSGDRENKVHQFRQNKQTHETELKGSRKQRTSDSSSLLNRRERNNLLW